MRKIPNRRPVLKKKQKLEQINEEDEESDSEENVNAVGQNTRALILNEVDELEQSAMNQLDEIYAQTLKEQADREEEKAEKEY